MPSHHAPRCSRPCARAERFSGLAAADYQSGRYQRAGLPILSLYPEINLLGRRFELEDFNVPRGRERSVWKRRSATIELL
jgi:hypothetical protein